MRDFDYEATAELFPSRRYAKSSQTQYRRFDTAAEALRYMNETVPASWLAGSILEVAEQRFDGQAIRALYEADGYPLARRKAAA